MDLKLELDLLIPRFSSKPNPGIIVLFTNLAANSGGHCSLQDKASLMSDRSIFVKSAPISEAVRMA